MGLIFKVLWCLKVPQAAKTCVWRVLEDRLPIRENLIRRGVVLHSSMCPLCLNQPETTHLFIECKVSIIV